MLRLSYVGAFGLRLSILVLAPHADGPGGIGLSLRLAPMPVTILYAGHMILSLRVIQMPSGTCHTMRQVHLFAPLHAH